MKDNRIEKIRAKVEKLKSQLIRGACSSQIAMETRCKEEAYNEVLAILDSSQEEPVSKDYRERYKRIAESEQFKKTHEGMSIGDIVPVEGEEPVSEDLEEAAHNQTYRNHAYAYESFIEGANWQKQQDQSTIELAEDHAMLAGMEKMKEQMMAKAKSGTVQKDNQVILDDGTYIDLDPSMQLKPSYAGLKEGVKVIVIKED